MADSDALTYRHTAGQPHIVFDDDGFSTLPSLATRTVFQWMNWSEQLTIRADQNIITNANLRDIKRS